MDSITEEGDDIKDRHAGQRTETNSRSVQKAQIMTLSIVCSHQEVSVLFRFIVRPLRGSLFSLGVRVSSLISIPDLDGPYRDREDDMDCPYRPPEDIIFSPLWNSRSPLSLS